MRLRDLLLCLPLLLVACSGNQTNRCVSHTDCFADEICLPEGICGDPSEFEEADVGANADTGPNGEEMGNDDMSMRVDMQDADPEPDMGFDATGSDAGPDQGPGGGCIVDPFEVTCDRADDNDSFADYLRFEPRPPGCQDGGDELETNELTSTNLQMCANETVDKYSTNLISCDTITFFVEVTVTPFQDCRPEDYTLNVEVQGNDCEEPNGKVECDTLPDGSKKVVAMVEPSSNVESAAITVGKGQEDVQFDYDLEVVVRR